MVGQREKQKAKRREMIETAAGELFETNGFDVTIIEEIAEKAQVSPPTVYNYYGNKDELLLALIAKGEAGTKSGLSDFVKRAETEDPAHLLSDIICSNVKDALKYMSREVWGHAVAYVAKTNNPNVATPYLEAVTDDLAIALTAAIKIYETKGILTPINAEKFAIILTRIEHSHFLGFIYLKEMSVEELNIELKKDISLLVDTIRA
ncbi:MAG: TetR/AcrR family transcriptional regulator [Emcibacteraceae bacterium]|nr:TetR/AcrR family transcriptional regulator [Emcibacteraceae bacterium]